MVQAIERGIELLTLLESKPLGITELSTATALPKATVHRLLKTYEKYKWVEQDIKLKKYKLSWGILSLARAFLSSLDVRTIASPYMRDIRVSIEQSVNLFLQQDFYQVCIERVVADKSLRNDIEVGAIYPIDEGAAGKIFGAYSNDSFLSVQESSDIKAQGYAITVGNHFSDSTTIAVPIFTINNKLAAVMTISGPTFEYKEDQIRDYVSILCQSSRLISKHMGAYT